MPTTESSTSLDDEGSGGTTSGTDDETDGVTDGGTDGGTDGDSGGSSSTGTPEKNPCESNDDCEGEQLFCCDSYDAKLFGCDAGYCSYDETHCGDDSLQSPLLVPPNVMLVLDKSGTMFNQDNFWDHDLDDMDDDGFSDVDPMMMATPKQSRWKTLHGAVTQIVSAFNDSMNLGAQLFPSMDGVAVLGPQACVVDDVPEALVSPNNGSSILDAIPPAGDLSGQGGTPAEKGMRSAINHLNGLDLEENQENYVILITDGAPNCSVSVMDDAALLDYDQNFVPTIAAAAAQPGQASIKTYVVGVDIKDEVDQNNINPFHVLNDAAIAGGVPKNDPYEKFYNVTHQLELQEALDGIIGEVLSCEIGLDSAPEASTPALVVDGELYPEPLELADCDSMDGWAFTDGAQTELVLCGGLCSAYQLLGEIQLKFICEP